MRNAVAERISRRTFTEPLSEYEAERIESMIEDANGRSGLTMELVRDASGAFSSKKYTKGFIRNATSAIMVKGPRDLPDIKEKGGYYGEGIVLDMVDMGLGTCWVAGTMDRSFFELGDGELLVCVIITGHVDKPKIAEKTVRAMVRSSHKSPSDMIESDREIPDNIMHGMEAVSLAPSAINKQKPHFVYLNGVLTAEVPDTYAMDLVDLGIAKRHFVETEGGRFDFGNGGMWHPPAADKEEKAE
ncbi:MAG: nitroreductase family protein [Anaerovoracaceae bacterium]|nr:nitroreductase family protein [Bacillota bacterium]MDY2671039.1 nitroreductase family protein [Anaerovoracaceae bacterium]